MGTLVSADKCMSATLTTCQECGQGFTPKVEWQKFCEDSCHDKFHLKKRKRPKLESPPGVEGLKKAGQINKIRAANFTTRKTKLQNVLAALTSGKSFNRFEAERELHDHCLHSTVAAIQKFGIIVNRRIETVPGFRGHPTHVARYWLDAENQKRAAKLLGWKDGTAQPTSEI